MTIDNYFNELNICLKRLSFDERKEALNFYTEYAKEGNLVEYSQMMECFGSPKSLSAQIYAESATKYVADENVEKNRHFKGFSLALIGLFTLPFSFSLFIALIFIAFALIVSLLAIVFSIGITLVSLGGTSIALFVKSFSFIVPFTPFLWLKSFGGSLILISVTALISILFFIAIKFFVKSITIFMSKTIKRRK